MTVEVTPDLHEYLAELAKEEGALVVANAELDRALVRFRVLSHKFAALRDVIARQIGVNPYSRSVQWPDKGLPTPEEPHMIVGIRGKFRYIHMKPGDAAVELLMEADKPLLLQEIIEGLQAGGMKDASPRAINAALINTGGVAKTEEGLYTFAEPSVEDMPR